MNLYCMVYQDVLVFRLIWCGSVHVLDGIVQVTKHVRFAHRWVVTNRLVLILETAEMGYHICLTTFWHQAPDKFILETGSALLCTANNDGVEAAR